MGEVESAPATPPHTSPTEVNAPVGPEDKSAHRLLAEQIEDLDKRRAVMRKLDAIEDILQTSDDLKQEKIQLWADRLEKHTRPELRL